MIWRWAQVPTGMGGGNVFPGAPVGPPNIGQVLINPNFLETSGGYEFLNLMKHAQSPWTLADSSNNLSPADSDSNGYPTALRVGGGVFTEVFIPSSTARPGNYVFTWTGNGTISCPGSTLVSGSFTGSGGSGRAVVSSPGSQIFITALPVTNMAYFHVNDETDLNNGFITGSKFRQRIAQAQTPVLRSLNWIGGSFAGTNSTPMAKWADRKPAGYFSYIGGEFRSSLFAGATTNSGNDYSITFGSGAPVDKQIIILNFNAAATDHSATVTLTSGTPCTVSWTAHGLSVNDPICFGGFNGPNLPDPMNLFMNFYVQNVVDANTINISQTRGGSAINTTSNGVNLTAMRSPTLTLNGGTPIPLKDQQGYPMWSGGGNLPGTNGYAGLSYDAGINQWYVFPDNGLDNGVPPEVFMQVCKELGCHPWYVTPPMTVDPMTDWHTQLATYLQANAPKWMIPRFECFNEPWNLLTQAGTRPIAYSFINWGATNYGDVPNFIGKIASTIGQDLASVYGAANVGKSYHAGINPQTGATTTWNDGLNSSSYVGQAAAPQSGYIKAAAKNYLSHVIINQYLSSAANESTANTNWQNAVGAAAKQAVLDGYLDDATLGFPASAVNNPDGVLGMQAVYVATFSWCQGFTNSQGAKIRMCGYEGGANAPVQFFPFWDACMTTGTNLQKYCAQNIQNFINAGGEHPALFQLSGQVPRADVWSSLIDIYQTPDPPEWLAIVSFNHP